MAEPVRTGAGTTPSSSPSGLSVVGWIIVAVAAQIALLDAAVETFWSGSPLRWWVASAVLVFAALSAFLWRPGCPALKRWGSLGAAWWSLGGLFLLLSVTAWLPGGQTNGVRMLLQPTPTVLIAATAAAVILAGFALFEAIALLPAGARMTCRAVVVAVVLYALLALALGIRDRTPFAALFQGGALWQRLPRWLQGAFIGGVVILPTAILGQVVRMVARLRRRESIRVLFHQSTALLMAFVMAVSGVALSGLAGTVVPATGSVPRTLDEAVADLERSYETVTEALTGVPRDREVQVPDRVQGLASLFSILQAAVAQVPRESFDPAAVLQTVGRNPADLFAWVRDRTYWVPYRGTLRGATGVLMDRLGNSLDRALLLSALLEAAGHPVRLARATLTARDAQELVKRVRPVPANPRPVPEQPGSEAAAIIDVALRGSNVDRAVLESALARFSTASAATATRVREEVDRQSRRLIEVVGGPEPVEAPADADAASDHWWVRIQQDGSWKDLDPALPDATFGSSLAAPSETMSASAVPDALRHAIMLRVVVEQLNAGRRSEHVALARVVRPADLFGQQIVFRNVPAHMKFEEELAAPRTGAQMAESLSQEAKWIPILRVGKQLYADSAVETTGKLTSIEASANQLSSDLGGFLGGGESVTAADSKWTAEWLEYEVRVPGRAPRKIRREIFDLLGPDRRTSGATTAAAVSVADELRRGLALIGDTTILPLGCRLSAEYVRWLKGSHTLANQRLLQAVLETGGNDTDGALSKMAMNAEPFPAALYELALARHAWNGQSTDVYLGAPNILTYHNALEPAADGAVVGVEGFDIVANDVAVRTDAEGRAFEIRVRQGVADSNAEANLLWRSCCGGAPYSAVRELTAGAENDPAWTAVRDATGADGIGLSADARARVKSEIAQGYVVVASAAARPDRGEFWRVDRATGQTLAIGRWGWGPALTEAQVMYFRIGLQVASFFVCQYRLFAGIDKPVSDREAYKRVTVFALCAASAALGGGAVAIAGPAGLTAQLWMGVAKDIVGIVVINAVQILV